MCNQTFEFWELAWIFGIWNEILYKLSGYKLWRSPFEVMFNPINGLSKHPQTNQFCTELHSSATWLSIASNLKQSNAYQTRKTMHRKKTDASHRSLGKKRRTHTKTVTLMSLWGNVCRRLVDKFCGVSSLYTIGLRVDCKISLLFYRTSVWHSLWMAYVLHGIVHCTAYSTRVCAHARLYTFW